MEVKDFACDPNFARVLPAAGISFRVGGCLQVKPDQPGGKYQGTLRVTVAYR
jgi:hypothetical protein